MIFTSVAVSAPARASYGSDFVASEVFSKVASSEGLPITRALAEIVDEVFCELHEIVSSSFKADSAASAAFASRASMSAPTRVRGAAGPAGNAFGILERY